MGKFEEDVVKPYADSHAIYVETGSLWGAGVAKALPYFDKIYSIELDDKLFQYVKQRFKYETKVKCLHGDSKEVLRDLIPELSRTTGTIFFLDAHWSGDDSTDWERSQWKGHVQTAFTGTTPTSENQVPLAGELQAITQLYQGAAVIYLDDMDKFDEAGNGRSNFKFQGEDWSHLTIHKLKSIVAPRLKSWTRVNEEQLLVELWPMTPEQMRVDRKN